MILAKSTGETLINHSINVKNKSIELYESSGHIKNDEKEIIRLSALLHDIGKATKGFQNFVKGKKNTNGYPHQHISWAFVNNICKLDNNIKSKVLNIIYWHHGVPNLSQANSSEILQSLSLEDINDMVEIAKELGVEIKEDYLETYEDDYTSPPKYYEHKTDYRENIKYNHKLIYLRLCVVLGDRISSGMEFNENYVGNPLNLEVCPFDDDTRFNKQKEVIAKTDKTSVIKAPTGYGKTMMGLMWYEKTNKKTLWVCPRNTVAISTYDSIIKELKNANKSLNIKLVYENETKKSNFDEDNEQADIIITNIDYFLRPYSNVSKDISLLGFMLKANVIFDEYHELVSDSPLFSLFINFMNIRNNVTNSETLLLSGTPIPLNYLWDTMANRTKILPNENSHLNAVHDKPFKINILDKKPNNIINDELYFTNTIKNSQKLAKKYENTTLIHSNFSKEDTERIMNDLDNCYGKNNTGESKPAFISTLVLEAALDVSFKSVYDTPLSPERTLQRIGRCNRWGEKDGGIVNIAIENEYNRGNSEIIKMLYSDELNELWIEQMKKLNGCEITLNKLYDLYNNFNKVNSKKIERLIKNKLNSSSQSLENNIYPIKYYNKLKSDTKIFKASSNKFRSKGNEIFYIVKDNSTNKWVGPFSENIRKDYQQSFNESGNILNEIKKIYKKEIINDDRFDYGPISEASYLNNISLDSVRHKARLNISPYIALRLSYDSRLGVLK